MERVGKVCAFQRKTGRISYFLCRVSTYLSYAHCCGNYRPPTGYPVFKPGYPGLEAVKPVNSGLKNTRRVCNAFPILTIYINPWSIIIYRRMSDAKTI